MTPTFFSPDITYDRSTTNYSFILVSDILKNKGIVNHEFMLALYDEDLKGVDIHDLGKDTEENEILRVKAMAEARKNGWFFLREVVKIRQAGSKPSSFVLDRASAAMAWCFFNGIDYISSIPRQCGNSTCALSLLSWVLDSSGYESTIGLFAKSDVDRKHSVARTKNINNLLPNWFVYRDPIKDKDNTDGRFYSALNNNFRSLIGPKEKDRADRMARGWDASVTYFDDPGYALNFSMMYPTMMAGTFAIRNKAEVSNKPHSNIFTITPPKGKSVEDEFIRSMTYNAMPFTELMYDFVGKRLLKEIVKVVSKNNMVHGKFNPLELGYTTDWLQTL